MTTFWLAVYILIFPTIAAVALGVIWVAAWREYVASRRGDDRLV